MSRKAQYAGKPPCPEPEVASQDQVIDFIGDFHHPIIQRPDGVMYTADYTDYLGISVPGFDKPKNYQEIF